MQWSTAAQFVCTVTRENVRLGVACQLVGDRWQVLALTTPVTTETAEDLFQDHSHKLVGTYASPTAAIAAGEGFARAWLRDFKATRFADGCECDEISG